MWTDTLLICINTVPNPFWWKFLGYFVNDIVWMATIVIALEFSLLNENKRRTTIKFSTDFSLHTHTTWNYKWLETARRYWLLTVDSSNTSTLEDTTQRQYKNHDSYGRITTGLFIFCLIGIESFGNYYGRFFAVVVVATLINNEWMVIRR